MNSEQLKQLGQGNIWYLDEIVAHAGYAHIISLLPYALVREDYVLAKIKIVDTDLVELILYTKTETDLRATLEILKSEIEILGNYIEKSCMEEVFTFYDLGLRWL